MQVNAIRTHCIQRREGLESILDRYVEFLPEESILAITSKIVSISQDRVVLKETCTKETLIWQEADAIVEQDSNPYNIFLTLKDNILIPSAGIDESNANDSYILYPQEVQEVAVSLWNYLRNKHAIHSLGIIITDSHTTPMRRGVTGITLGWCGFEPLYSYIGKPDIYTYPLRMTYINILDALATAAVFVMGEGNEQTPLALIQHAPKIQFLERPPTLEEKESILIPMHEDIYAPFLNHVNWQRKDKCA